jgi:hypothetical protein
MVKPFKEIPEMDVRICLPHLLTS